MRRLIASFAAFAALVLCGACGPAVTIRRMAPAPYNLGPAHKLALVEAAGPSPRKTELVRARFLQRVDEQGVFQIEDAVPPAEDVLDFLEWLFSKDKPARGRPDPAEFRRRHPADVYVRLRVTDIRSWRREEAEKKDGKETGEHRYWAEAECSFQVTLVDGRDGTRFARFTITRKANSPIYKEWHDGLRDTAEKDSVNQGVDEALAQFTPQWVSETLFLDDKAPRAAEGAELLKSGDLKGARTLWEGAAKENPGSAGVAFNLGCVSEALGDTTAATRWYAEAIRLDPSSERNQKAAADLSRRLRDAERLRRGD